MNEEATEICPKECYDKIGSGGSTGNTFQINLIIMFMFNALEKLSSWWLSTENKIGAKFDDIVFEYSDRSEYGAVLLQAKYRQNYYRITDKDLFSVSKNNDFCLAKYFFSYHTVKSNFKTVKSVILCTNADIVKNQERMEMRVLTPEDMLYYEKTSTQQDKKICCTFKHSIIEKLKKSILNYRDECFNDQFINANEIEENVKEFLDHLQFIVRYPGGGALEEMIKIKISRSKFGKNLNYEVAYAFLFLEMKTWYEKTKGAYMKSIDLKWIFSKMLSYKYCEELKGYQIVFGENNVIVRDGKKVIHVVPEKEKLLHIIKIHQALPPSETLFVPPAAEEGIQLQIIDVFNNIRFYKYLVITRSAAATQGDDKFISQIKRIFNKEKTVILIAEREDVVAKRLEETCKTFYSELNDHISFSHLAEDTRKMFLDKMMKFQGELMSVENWLPTDDSRNLVLTCDVLAKFVRDETISVGTNSERFDNSNYISRELYSVSLQETRTEEGILKEKLILISSSAGMGKSTVLKKIATIIKESSPHLWVIRIDLNRCTSILKSFQMKERVDIAELLNSLLLKDTSDVENKLFSLPERIVLLVDGVDEVSPYYTDTVLDVLTQCKDSNNFQNIIVTTRPHLQKQLEGRLRTKSWNLVPFTKLNQKDFLINYCVKDLNTLVQSIQTIELVLRCTGYIDALVDKLSKSKSFAGNPLQTRMLAEVFQEKIRNNTGLDERDPFRDLMDPNLPERINFVRLYQLFIENKRTIFIEEKGNPTGNVTAEESLKESFKQWYGFHHILALRHVVDGAHRSLFTCYKSDENTVMEENLLKVGIVDAAGFIHRTFAEYFVTECIVKQLNCNDNIDAFYNYLITVVLSSVEYSTVRIFLNAVLDGQTTLDKLCTPSPRRDCVDSTFNWYQCLHVLAQENHTSILNFIYTKFSCRKEKGCFKQLLRPLFNRKTAFSVDAMDDGNCTALHVAASLGHMDSVKYLVEQGANVNNRDSNGDTPLLEAARGGYFDVVQYLVGNGAEVNCQANSTDTPLLEASRFGYSDIVLFLIQRGADPNVENVERTTVLHIMVLLGYLELVQQVLQMGIDVNLKDERGVIALQIAVVKKNADMIKLLVDFGANINAVYENWDRFITWCSSPWFDDHEDLYLITGGTTSLHVAVVLENLELAKILVEYEAYVNVRDQHGCTPLHVAARRGFWDMMEFLMENGGDLHIRSSRGRTVLQEAIYYSNFSIHPTRYSSNATFNSTWNKIVWRVEMYQALHFSLIRNLLRRGANIICSDDLSNIPLETCSSCYLVIASLKIQNGADSNVRRASSSDATPLQHFISKLDPGNRLLEFKVNAKDEKEGTVFHIAVTSRIATVVFAMVTLLLDLGAEVSMFDVADFVSERYFDWIGSSSRFPFRRSCMDIVDSIAASHFTHLHQMLAMADLESARNLIENSKCINNVEDRSGTTPLHMSARLGYFRIVELLIEKGADPNIPNDCGRTTLHEAARFSGFSIDMLLCQYLNQNCVGDWYDTIWSFETALGPDFDIVRCLVTAGADINRRDNYGNTPLLEACITHNFPMVWFLVQQGADVDKANDCLREDPDLMLEDMIRMELGDGFTPLHVAVALDEKLMVRILVEHGAGVNVKDRCGCTPLHVAARMGHLKTAKFLVRKGADFDIQDDRGRTALHEAGYKSNIALYDFLVTRGADQSLVDNDGRTALHEYFGRI